MMDKLSSYSSSSSVDWGSVELQGLEVLVLKKVQVALQDRMGEV